MVRSFESAMVRSFDGVMVPSFEGAMPSWREGILPLFRALVSDCAACGRNAVTGVRLSNSRQQSESTPSLT